MTAQNLKELKKALDTQKQTFLARLDYQIDHPELYRTEVLEKLTESEANLLGKIDLALARIENDTYGICVACNEAIPLERLQAKPSVSLCLNCQDKHEHNV